MRIVALRALGLGDLLTAVPALRALQDLVGAAPIAVAAPRPLAPMIRWLGWEAIAAAPLAALPRAAQGADLLVNLHGCGPESHRVALAAAPRRMLAFHHPAIPQTARMPRWRSDEHEVERWCRLLREDGIAASPARLRLPAPCATPQSERWRGATVVHPGASAPARRWPATRFAAVARAERAAGRPVVVTGNAAERPLALRVARAAGLDRSAVVAGATDVVELASLVARAGRVVCGDTGVAHLATALGTPSVVLFGPTAPARWGPPSSPMHRVLWACEERGRGDLGDPHGRRPDPALLRITADEVVGALDALPAPR